VPNERIIIVEDDPVISETMMMILQSVGYSVTTFLDGTMILDNDYTHPDIFIIDKQLQGIDGLDICRHLKSSKETMDIPVILVSASCDLFGSAKKALADDALEKPFKMKELRDIVAKHLNK
jgi:DNA-binding response OmpR family regulator